jgi:hypothetical protein
VRARTHISDTPASHRSTSNDTLGRPSLRLIPGDMHIVDQPEPATESHAPPRHLAGATEALADHPVAATHPPTVADAAQQIWLDPDEVRHGLVGQIAAALAGLVQVVGLGACWAMAHVFFATKTRAAVFLLVLTVALAAYALAGNA